MFLGGEFYDDEHWITQSPTLLENGSLFLNGGRACLTVIADYLRAVGINRFLLPSYLCPSILNVLDQCGCQYSFYQINEDFSINLEDLSRTLQSFQAVYFINYFGFTHPPEVISYFQKLQKESFIVVEDNAQAGFAVDPIGDFAFNSLRKFTASDGGYLTSKVDLSPFLMQYRGRKNHRLPLIRQYRKGLTDYLFTGRGSHSELEHLFYQAEMYYEEDQVVLGDPLEKTIIEQQDWKGIKEVRRRNYTYLIEQLDQIPEIKPLFPTLQTEIIPLGLPVYVSKVSRDLLNEELAKSGISLTIHWDALLDDPRTRTNPLVRKMAGRILTLPVDQYTSLKQLDYLVSTMCIVIQKITTT